MMLIDDLGADPVAALPPGSGTIPAIGGSPALTYKPVEQARGLYTLYGYWDSSKLAGAPLYYQWTYNQSAPRLPTTPQPPMGQFPTLDAARAAMMAQLSIQAPQPTQAPAPVVSAPQFVPPTTYATMPLAPEDRPAEPFPAWAKVAVAAAAGIGLALFLRSRMR